MMQQQALKKNIKKTANELDVGDEVRILNNALTQIKKYGSMKQTSLKKQGKLFNYTKKIYIVVEKKQFPDGMWKYKIDGYTSRCFPSAFLLKVDTRGMVALGSNIQKGIINFHTTFDREAHLQSLHANTQAQAQLTPAELDAQDQPIDEEKKKQALAQASDLPPVRRSKRQKKTKQKQLAVGSKFKHDGRTFTIIKLYKKNLLPAVAPQNLNLTSRMCASI
jgi:hypothetical protein